MDGRKRIICVCVACACGWWTVAAASERVGQAREKTPEAECGYYCLMAAAISQGVAPDDVRLKSVRDDHPPISSIGYSFDELRDLASEFGLQARLLETSVDKIARRRPPFACIAHIDEGHFVCVVDYDASRDAMRIYDPASAGSERPFVEQERELFDRRWSGFVLIVSRQSIPDDPMALSRILLWIAPFACIAMAVIVTVVLRRRKRLLALVALPLIGYSGCNEPERYVVRKPATVGPVLVCENRDVRIEIVGHEVPPLVAGRAAIRNSGDETLRLVQISRSCGCTEVKPTSIAIPSGEEALLDVTIKTAGHASGSAEFQLHTNGTPAAMKFYVSYARKADPRFSEPAVTLERTYAPGESIDVLFEISFPHGEKRTVEGMQLKHEGTFRDQVFCEASKIDVEPVEGCGFIVHTDAPNVRSDFQQIFFLTDAYGVRLDEATLMYSVAAE